MMLRGAESQPHPARPSARHRRNEPSTPLRAAAKGTGTRGGGRSGRGQRWPPGRLRSRSPPRSPPRRPGGAVRAGAHGSGAGAAEVGVGWGVPTEWSGGAGRRARGAAGAVLGASPTRFSALPGAAPPPL